MSTTKEESGKRFVPWSALNWHGVVSEAYELVMHSYQKKLTGNIFSLVWHDTALKEWKQRINNSCVRIQPDK